MSERSESAQQLFRAQKTGTLATQSVKKPGYPFASVMPYAIDGRGRPLFLLSGLAAHTKNLLADPRSTLLITEPASFDDPMETPRLMLIGQTVPVAEEEREPLQQRYLAVWPDAQQWLEFGDFALFRLEPEEVYYIGGFGAMGWVSPSDFLT
jgi:putative heme iron utilization protein